MSRRRRGLTEEDLTLWRHVTESVAPLPVRRKRRKGSRPAAEAASAAAPEPASVPPPPPPAPAPPQAAMPALPRKPAPPPLPPLAAIDRNERRKLVRGTRAIDGRIDLHGMRQAEAHGALRGFLAHSQMRGDTLVLVITGKGRESEAFAFEERGILRRMVPQWLRMPDLRHFVVGFEEAHQGHGGGGALYVRLRRDKARRP